MLAVGIVVQNEAVVLIRVEKIFATASRTHDHQREFDRGIAPASLVHGRKLELDDAAMDVAIDLRKEHLNLRRRHVVLEQRSGNFHLRRLDLAQSIEAVLVRKALDGLHNASCGHLQGIVHDDHADRAVGFVDHRQMMPAMATHRRNGDIEIIVGSHRDHRRRHDVGKRLLAGTS